MKVSVIMITYNHERFIEQAIESVLAQQADFDYELLIGEDCSTDNTAEIVRRYQRKHPNRIRTIMRRENVGGRRNAADLNRMVRGQYLALLEGDDYWTCPEKLQRQVDFLDAHADYAVSFHSAKMEWEDGSHPPVFHTPPGRKPSYTLEELLVHDFVSTSTIMVRHGLFPAYPDWYWKAPVGDWPFLVLHAMHGKLGYIDECWSTYRQHSGGIHSSLSEEKRLEQRLDVVRLFRDVLGPQYRDLLTRSLHARCLTLALHYQKTGRQALAKKYAGLSIDESDSNPMARWRNMAKVRIYMSVPWLYDFVAGRRETRLADKCAQSLG
jgi:glycosyltransferase involved in cell wall biosynthesis